MVNIDGDDEITISEKKALDDFSKCTNAHKTRFEKYTMDWDYVNKTFGAVEEIGTQGMFDKYDYPSEFDPLLSKPECKLSVQTQHSCGSCYIFGTTNVLRRRLCLE